MRQQDQVIAIVCADIHLTLRPPRARRKEEDWLKAMKRSLDELEGLAKYYKAPILCAGDIFDHWKVEPELINFALGNLPEMIAIPGQHDLPLHNHKLIKKSAFWTLVLAGKIHPVFPKRPFVQGNLMVCGFPYGMPLKSTTTDKSNFYKIALVHAYLWKEGYAYQGAAAEAEVSHIHKHVTGYHAVIYGDNHSGFKEIVNGVPIFNCGTFFRRRTTDERYYPTVGLVCSSGAIISHRLCISKDAIETAIDIEEEDLRYGTLLEADDLVAGMLSLQNRQYDFAEALKIAMQNQRIKPGVKRIILEVLERD